MENKKFKFQITSTQNDYKHVSNKTCEEYRTGTICIEIDLIQNELKKSATMDI